MYRLFLSLIICLFILNCKTIQDKNTETTGKIIFKSLLNNSKNISDVYISGALKISGVEEIPPVYIGFKSIGNLKTNDSSFRILLIKKPIIDIRIEEDQILFINHTSRQYIHFNLAEVNLAKLFGININPNEISYFLLGKIPYTQDMELMKFDITNNNYYLEITNQTSKYDILLNKEENIINAISDSQFFDRITLESIRYTKNDDNEKIPKIVNFRSNSKENDISLSFLINNISYKKNKEQLFNIDIIKEYTEVKDINQIEIKLRSNH